MGGSDEICFEAPEISMSSDITLDARMSVVTVSKLTNINVSANCYCPGSVTPPPAKPVDQPVAKPQPKSPPPVVDIPPAAPVEAKPAEVAPPAPLEAKPVEVKPDEPVEESVVAPADVPADVPAAVETADDTAMSSAETAPKSESASDPILEYKDIINVAGTFTSTWKSKNVPGKYELFKEDDIGRPIYKRVEPTQDGGSVYMYHIHHSKKWRVGPDYEGKPAYNCWLYITSKVDQPLMIAKDQERTKRNWKEFDVKSNKWIEIKDMTITKA